MGLDAGGVGEFYDLMMYTCFLFSFKWLVRIMYVYMCINTLFFSPLNLPAQSIRA